MNRVVFASVCFAASAVLSAVASTAELTWTLKDGKTVVEKVELAVKEGGQLEVLTIPQATLRDRKAKELKIVPEFARARKGEKGFWFSPYGLYGEYERENGFFTAGVNRMSMPMFGWSTPRGAYLAIVTSLKYFVRERVQVRNGDYAIAALLQEELLSDPYEDLVIEYHRRAPTASYAELAKIYRAYQLGRGAVRPFRARFAENKILEKAIMAPEVRIRQAWKPVPSPVRHQAPENEPEVKPVVTFDRVKDIVDEFKRQGVDEAEFCLVGWNIGGHDGRWPQYFPSEPKLGGDAKLREAIRYAKEKGYLIVPHGNFVEGYTVASSWDAEWVSKHRDGSWVLYDANGKTTWGGGQPYKMCPQRSYEKFCSTDIPRLAAFGFQGIGYFDVTTIVEPKQCFDPRHPCNFKQGCEYWGKCAALSQRDLGGFSSESGNDYIAGNFDYSLYTYFGDPRKVEEAYAGGKALPKKVVPVWKIVYNGIIADNPFTVTMNAPLKDRYSQLKCVEFSGRASFYFYSKFKTDGKSWMGDEDLTSATDEELRRSVAHVKRGYDEYKQLRHLQLEFLEEHGETAPGVFTSTYSNGEKVIVDYNKGEWRLVRTND